MTTLQSSEFKAILDEAASGDLDAWFHDSNITERDRTLSIAVRKFLEAPVEERARLREATSHLKYARLLEDFAARMKNRAAKEKSPLPLDEALRTLIVHGFVTREAEMLLMDIFDVARLKLKVDSR